MREMTEQQDKRKATKRRRRFALLAVAISFLAAVVALIWYRSGLPSVEERLAAIEAAREIPDSENAATIYDDLLKDPDAVSLSGQSQEFLDDETLYQVSTRPWRGTDHPQLAAWITQRQYIIDKLLEAGRFDKCRFPIVIDMQQMGYQMERTGSMRWWAFLLRFAANNDLAAGRIDAAISKWQCILQMGNHVRQQPTILDQLCAEGIEGVVWPSIARLVVEGAPTETHLRKIEAMPLQTPNELGGILKDIDSVEDMSELKLTEDHPFIGRLMLSLFSRTGVMPRGPGIDDIRRTYLRQTASARGVRIAVALRRHKNKFGAWPETLDEIRPAGTAERFVDPFNKGDFVYRLTDDGFRLYSKGENNVDEDGQCSNDSAEGPDDWPIWPPRGRKTQSQAAKSE